ncbi:MAG: hypothetical protein ROR55_09035 [Devosia sp.]
MSDKNLVPTQQDPEKRGEAKRARLERRQRMLAQRGEAFDVDEHDARKAQTVAKGPGQIAIVQPETFVLPPRVQTNRKASSFSRFIQLSFCLVVLLPALLAGLFYGFVASDQYATQSSFAVRGASSSSSAVDITSLFSMGAGGASSESADSYILQEYIHSREMVEALVSEANFLEIYSRPNVDAYYRLDPSVPIEGLVEYWQTMSAVVFDVDTGIISLTIRAFRPGDAEVITRKVIEKSEALVNDLSMRAREDGVRSAQREVKIAETRFADARKALAGYRGTEREIDPTAAAATRQGLVGNLEGELATLEAQLNALLATMSETSPRVTYVKNQIRATREQIEAERRRVAVADEGQSQPVLTERLSRYEELLAEREFAEKAYVSALAALEAARIEALKQQSYLAVFVRGAAPEESTFPEGFRWTAILAASLFLVWGVMALIAAAVRDRVA